MGDKLLPLASLAFAFMQNLQAEIRGETDMPEDTEAQRKAQVEAGITVLRATIPTLKQKLARATNPRERQLIQQTIEDSERDLENAEKELKNL